MVPRWLLVSIACTAFGCASSRTSTTDGGSTSDGDGARTDFGRHEGSVRDQARGDRLLTDGASTLVLPQLRGVNDSWTLCQIMGHVTASGATPYGGISESPAAAKVTNLAGFDLADSYQAANFFFKYMSALKSTWGVNYLRIGAHDSVGTETLYRAFRQNKALFQQVLKAMVRGVACAGGYVSISASGFAESKTGDVCTSACPGRRPLSLSGDGYASTANLSPTSTDVILNPDSASWNHYTEYLVAIAQALVGAKGFAGLELANAPDYPSYVESWWKPIFDSDGSGAKDGPIYQGFQRWVRRTADLVHKEVPGILLSNGELFADKNSLWRYMSNGCDHRYAAEFVVALAEGLDIVGFQWYQGDGATCDQCYSSNQQCDCSWRDLATKIVGYAASKNQLAICNNWGESCTGNSKWVPHQAQELEQAGLHHACIESPAGAKADCTGLANLDPRCQP